MKNKAVIIAFFVVLAASLTLLLLPADRESIQSENREIQKIPSLNRDNIFSGKFAEEFEAFLGDNAAFRGKLTQFSRFLDENRGMTLRAGKVISTNKDIGTGTVQKQTLLLANNAIMEMFIRNHEQEEAYAEAVNAYAKSVPYDVKVYSMLIPTQIEFSEPIYKNLQDNQQDAIESIYEKLDSNVTTVDVYGALKKHKDEYIYFRTDHHWTTLGAYYGYREFMAAAGGEAVNRSDYHMNEIHNVLGYLYDRAPASDTLPDTIEWYEIDKNSKIKTVMHNVDKNGNFTDYRGVMYERTKANYLFFFGSDHPVVDMTNTEKPDGKTIVVVKDSYANVFAPWLIKSYKRVILIDPRIYTRSMDAVIKEFKPNELLIMNYVFTTSFKDYTDLMKKGVEHE